MQFREVRADLEEKLSGLNESKTRNAYKTLESRTKTLTMKEEDSSQGDKEVQHKGGQGV